MLVKSFLVKNSFPCLYLIDDRANIFQPNNFSVLLFFLFSFVDQLLFHSCLTVICVLQFLFYCCPISFQLVLNCFSNVLNCSSLIFNWFSPVFNCSSTDHQLFLIVQLFSTDLDLFLNFYSNAFNCFLNAFKCSSDVFS